MATQHFVKLPSTETCAVLCEPPAMQRYCPASIPVRPCMVSSARFASLFMLYLFDVFRAVRPLNHRTTLGEGANSHLRVTELFSFASMSSKCLAT